MSTAVIFNFSTKKTVARCGLILGLTIWFVIFAIFGRRRTVVQDPVKVTTVSTPKRVFADKTRSFHGIESTPPAIRETSFEETTPAKGSSHPLENSCKFPLLDPNDPNLSGYVRHPRTLSCNKVQPEFTTQDDDGFLYVHDDTNSKIEKLPKNPVCFYRGMDGSLRPNITDVEYTTDWVKLEKKDQDQDPRFWVPHDQYLIKCFHPKDTKQKDPLHVRAYAHFTDHKGQNSKPISDDQLAINILVIDSIAHNQFRRHMAKTYPFMRDVMKFRFFNGYNKVADNSMVNLLPVLAGLRYVNQSDSMPSDILPMTYEKTLLNFEDYKFIWNIMKERGCITLLNDDVGHHTRGIFHYPWKQAKGFQQKPTDYYFRPFYVYNYRWPVANSSKYCIGSQPIAAAHFGLAEQFIRKFSNTCHFSFSFLTDLTHDDPNRVETIDDLLHGFLERLYSRGQLNHTAVIIMGDHGNRIATIRYSFIGRFEERLPLLSIYLPDWFQQKHPHLVQSLDVNRNRLASNFDLYQTLLDIAQQQWTSPIAREGRGMSLFRPLPKDRSCHDAGIPEQYCTCLKPSKELSTNDSLVSKATETVFNFLKNIPCLKEEAKLNLTQVTVAKYLMTQPVRHGIKYFDKEANKTLQAQAALEIIYLEVDAEIFPQKIRTKTRLKYYQKTPEKMWINVEPLILNTGQTKQCSEAKMLSDFCNCSKNVTVMI